MSSSTCFAIGDRVAMIGDTQWTAVVFGIGAGFVRVEWDHVPTGERFDVSTDEIEHVR